MNCAIPSQTFVVSKAVPVAFLLLCRAKSHRRVDLPYNGAYADRIGGAEHIGD